MFNQTFFFIIILEEEVSGIWGDCILSCILIFFTYYRIQIIPNIPYLHTHIYNSYFFPSRRIVNWALTLSYKQYKRRTIQPSSSPTPRSNPAHSSRASKVDGGLLWGISKCAHHNSQCAHLEKFISFCDLMLCLVLVIYQSRMMLKPLF